MTRKNDISNLEKANAKAISIFESGMGRGRHSFRQRLDDFVTPAGNSTGLRCLLGGHKWHLGDPDEHRFNPTPGFRDFVDPETGRIDFEEIETTFPEDPTWGCFCSRCGAGSRFEEIPPEAFDSLYRCFSCQTTVDGDEIISHIKMHIGEENRWPVYSGGWEDR